MKKQRENKQELLNKMLKREPTQEEAKMIHSPNEDFILKNQENLLEVFIKVRVLGIVLLSVLFFAPWVYFLFLTNVWVFPGIAIIALGYSMIDYRGRGKKLATRVSERIKNKNITR